MTGITAKELHDLNPLGAYVTYSDGAPKPPARFVKKMSVWESSNNWGYFVGRNPGNPAKSYDTPRFTLQQNHGMIVFNRIFGLTGALAFTVKPPHPGTILAFSTYAEPGTDDVSHIWRDENDARLWATKPPHHYKFSEQSLRYMIVGADGKLHDHAMKDV